MEVIRGVFEEGRVVTRVVVNVKEGARGKKEHSGLEAWIVPESCQTPKKRPEKGIMTRPDNVFAGRLPRVLLCFDIVFNAACRATDD